MLELSNLLLCIHGKLNVLSVALVNDMRQPAGSNIALR